MKRLARSAREWQGLEIAATVKLRRMAECWIVPSQTGPLSYAVNPTAGWCTCTDYQIRKVKCKHLWAVEFTAERENA